jgi:hypothetical protein
MTMNGMSMATNNTPIKPRAAAIPALDRESDRERKHRRDSDRRHIA